MNSLWMQIGSVILLVAFFVMVLPGVRHQLKHGRKGSTSEWLNVALLLGGVVLFVLLLMSLI